MSDRDLDLAHRRLVNRLRKHATDAAASAATAAAAAVTADTQSVVDAHNDQRQFVHGVGPLRVAKTKNASQYPDWTEIENVPSYLRSAISPLDPTTLELDGAQITTGTVVLARLPVAGPGETSTTKLVRGDDPRLTSRAWACEAGEMLPTGSVVTVWADGRCGLASAASATTTGVGVVAESYGMGQQAIIWPFGKAEVYLPGVTSADIPTPVYLATTPGRVTLTLPSFTPGVIIQSIGTVIGIVSTTVARVAVCISAVEEVA